MVVASKSRAGWWFGGLLLVLLLIERQIIQLPEFTAHPALPFAVSFDVVIGIPVLFYFLVVRPYRWPLTTVVASFAAAIAIGYQLLPPAHQTYLGWAEQSLLLAEGLLVVLALVNLRRLRQAYRAAATHDPDVVANLRGAFQAVFGRPLAPLVSEASQFYYALFSWRARPEVKPSDQVFTTYRESAFTAYMLIVGLISLVEMGGVHLLLMRWSSTAALVAGVLHAYGLLWLLAHLRAVRLRPVRLTAAGELVLGTSFLWELRVPATAVVAYQRLTDTPEAAPGLLNLAGALLTPPNLRLTFREPQLVRGFYGLTRSVQQVAVLLDDPQGFQAALLQLGIGAEAGASGNKP